MDIHGLEVVTESHKIKNIREQRQLPAWEDIKPHIIEFGRVFLYNEDVQRSKTLSDKIKELSKKDTENHEQIIKLMLGY